MAIRHTLALGLGVLTGVIVATNAAHAADPLQDAAAPLPYVDLEERWAGLYGGAHVGYGEAGSLDGFVGGFQVGHNWQADRFVYGLEADVTLSDISEEVSVPGASASASVDWMTTVRGRGGFLITPNVMAYGTAGVGVVSTSVDVSVLGAGLSKDDSDAGFVFGLGIEGAITERMSARFEYMDVNDVDVVRTGLNYKLGK